MTIKVWIFILIIVAALLVGAVIGFFISRKVFKNYLEKNPPITEKSVRAMLSQMGRKPSEKQVKQVYNALLGKN